METKQVKFVALGEEAIMGGILITDGDKEYVICGCCGGIFEMEDIEILQEFSDWVDISYSIIGE